VLQRYQEWYPDFGPTLAAEKLALEGLVVKANDACVIAGVEHL
jgi:hypothetical protein